MVERSLNWNDFLNNHTSMIGLRSIRRSSMASNSFGQIFRITTFGESHGPAIGVVIDGCPAGLSLQSYMIQEELNRRSPGKTPYTSPRKEPDIAEILSGVFEGQTTGAPIAILIRNQDAKSSAYDPIKHLLRPGHANYTYKEKYGVVDPRGGGRSSARETAARVAAGAVAKQLLSALSIECVAFLSELGGMPLENAPSDLFTLREQAGQSPIFCPDPASSQKMVSILETIKQDNDSCGGIVSCIAKIPSGLGDPVYGKLEALLASAMLSIPASKGFEIGEGFGAARMRGSDHNDLFTKDESGKISCPTNHAGGTLGGISTGEPLIFRVAFKPTSSIRKPQQTVDSQGNVATLTLPETSRHDPCVAIRAVPVVEAMTALVLADAVLMNGRV